MEGLGLMEVLVGLGILFLLICVIDLISSAINSSKKQERARLELIAKSEFENWFYENLELLKNESSENINEGRKYVLDFEKALMLEAKNNPIDFIYNYYSSYSSSAMVGTEAVLRYSSEYNFKNTLDLDLEKFQFDKTSKKFNFYLNGVSMLRVDVRNKLNSNLKTILLESLTPRKVQDAFYSSELNLADFKEDTYSYFKSRYYKGKRYIKHGPFQWLREARYFNPGTITRNVNSSKKQKRSIERKRKYYEAKYVDNSKKFEWNENKVKSKMDYNAKDLNDHIGRNSYTPASKQPFVKKSSEIPVVNNESLNRFQKVSTVNLGKANRYENQSTVSSDPAEFREAPDKHMNTKTKIYILCTPFQDGQMIDIKVGESTNIKSRIDHYRQYWRNKFQVVFISDGIVQDENDLKRLLEIFHDSNEYYKIDIHTMQLIVTSLNISELLSKLDMHLNVAAKVEKSC